MRELFDSEKTIVVTIGRHAGGFIAAVRRRPDAELWEATGQTARHPSSAFELAGALQVRPCTEFPEDQEQGAPGFILRVADVPRPALRPLSAANTSRVERAHSSGTGS
jgi:hypothetical protein